MGAFLGTHFWTPFLSKKVKILQKSTPIYCCRKWSKWSKRCASHHLPCRVLSSMSTFWSQIHNGLVWLSADGSELFLGVMRFRQFGSIQEHDLWAVLAYVVEWMLWLLILWNFRNLIREFQKFTNGFGKISCLGLSLTTKTRVRSVRDDIVQRIFRWRARLILAMPLHHTLDCLFWLSVSD